MCRHFQLAGSHHHTPDTSLPVLIQMESLSSLLCSLLPLELNQPCHSTGQPSSSLPRCHTCNTLLMMKLTAWDLMPHSLVEVYWYCRGSSSLHQQGTWISLCWYTDSKKQGIPLKGTGTAIPLQAWTGPEGSRRLRFPGFKKGVRLSQPYVPTTFSP